MNMITRRKGNYFHISFSNKRCWGSIVPIQSCPHTSETRGLPLLPFQRCLKGLLNSAWVKEACCAHTPTIVINVWAVPQLHSNIKDRVQHKWIATNFLYLELVGLNRLINRCQQSNSCLVWDLQGSIFIHASLQSWSEVHPWTIAETNHAIHLPGGGGGAEFSHNMSSAFPHSHPLLSGRQT